MTRALVCALLLLAGCASKEAAIQSGLNGGVVACEVLLLDKTIETEPGAREWCARLLNGCRELPTVTR